MLRTIHIVVDLNIKLKIIYVQICASRAKNVFNTFSMCTQESACQFHLGFPVWIKVVECLPKMKFFQGYFYTPPSPHCNNGFSICLVTLSNIMEHTSWVQNFKFHSIHKKEVSHVNEFNIKICMCKLVQQIITSPPPTHTYQKNHIKKKQKKKKYITKNKKKQ